MRTLRVLRYGAFATLLVAIILGVVVIDLISGSRHWEERASRSMLKYALAERALQLDLLDERAGIIRNYDVVDTDVSDADNSLASLQHSELSTSARSILSKLIADNAQQEARVDEFNSKNALLQNALIYLTGNDAQSAGMQLLTNRVLKLSLDTSPTTVSEAQAAIELMPELPGGSADTVGSETNRQVMYARQLVTVLPEIDQLLTSIRDTHVEALVNDLQGAISSEAAAHATEIRGLEFALIIVTALLIAMLIALFSAQRAHTLQLEAQAATERLSAAIAVPLIDTGSDSFLSRVEESARGLAAHVKARRLQLLIPGVANCLRCATPAIRMNADWLPSLVAAADLDGAWSDDRVVASFVNHKDSALGRSMAELGIQDIVLLRVAAPFRVLIGFEPEDPKTAHRSDYLAGLASAVIAVAHGARREVMELERKSLERTLARTRRMEKLGAIASGVAHNFNNIIGAISGFAEIGQDRAKKGSVEQDNYDAIQSAVDRGRSLVDDILDYAKQGRSTKAPVALSSILTETVRMLSVAARDDTLFNLERPIGNSLVLASAADLQQVFLNICNNAAQASDGQSVTISVDTVNVQNQEHLSHEHLDRGDYVVVTVVDHGPGIPDGLKARLFEPFFTTKAMGSGLGLSTAWEIIRGHGGTIDVQNGPTGGAQFSIWLPEMAAGSDGQVMGSGARVALIADADRLSDDEEMLAELGYEPIGCHFSADRTTILKTIEGADAVLISTWQVWTIADLIDVIGPAAGARLVLLSVPENELLLPASDCVVLSYPPRSDQISAALREIDVDLTAPAA